MMINYCSEYKRTFIGITVIETVDPTGSEETLCLSNDNIVVPETRSFPIETTSVWGSLVWSFTICLTN